jgi:putative hydrolase of the HAD superfamily
VIPAEISSPWSCQKVLSLPFAAASRSVCDGMLSILATISTKAVFFDALGTLVELEPPWIGLRAAIGDDISDERLAAAVKAEMAYYRDHSHEGRDPASLAALRERSAAVLSESLGQRVDAGTLIDAIHFRAYPDAEPALEALRRDALRLICVSNWDCSLGSVLERCGLAALLDGAVSSAEAGARKPDPAIFAPALELAGCQPGEALHVGDTAEEDLAGARAAGIEALLIDRGGDGDIASLDELPERLREPVL